MTLLEKTFTDARSFARCKTALLCWLLTLIFTHVVTAQSGRAPRQPAPPPIATPTGDAPAERTPTPAETPTLALVVTDYIPGPNVTIGTGVAFSSFVERLRESSRVSVATEKEMRLKDAIDLALALFIVLRLIRAARNRGAHRLNTRSASQLARQPTG